MPRQYIGGMENLSGGMDTSIFGLRNTAPLNQIAGVQALFDLDATLKDSYSGSGQTWANLISAPDDGSGQTAYDFYRGTDGSATATDPTFTGTAGDPAAYWSMDGGDWFRIAGGNTAILRDMHKTTGGSPVTIILAFQVASTQSQMWGTATYNSNSNGCGFYYYQSPDVYPWQQTGVTIKQDQTNVGAWSAGDNVVMAVAFDYTAGSRKRARNARTFTTGTLTSTANTTNASTVMTLGGDASSKCKNGTRIYHFSMFNKLLSDAELASVIDVLNSRHQRTYA